MALKFLGPTNFSFSSVSLCSYSFNFHMVINLFFQRLSVSACLFSSSIFISSVFSACFFSSSSSSRSTNFDTLLKKSKVNDLKSKFLSGMVLYFLFSSVGIIERKMNYKRTVLGYLLVLVLKMFFHLTELMHKALQLSDSIIVKQDTIEFSSCILAFVFFHYLFTVMTRVGDKKFN